ncbi:hydrolase [Mycobacterium tuberculosis '98-R604 INH-RIF-EM']|nr:hydrolase [Mycobacterium tuberculosis '98-R604 INH-RIF-EM']CCE38176.1 unnamed protein product [Mycobacterium tuberculosis UT205]
MTRAEAKSSASARRGTAYAAVPHRPRLSAGIPDRRFRAGDSAYPRDR